MVDVVRRIIVQGRSQGLDTVAGGLRDLTAAQKGLAAASQTTATVTEMSARRQLSVSNAYQRLLAQTDEAVRAQQRFTRDLRTLDTALGQGITSVAGYTRTFDALIAKYGQVATASQRAFREGIRPPVIDQSALNAQLGIRMPVEGTARASAEAFEFGAELDRLRAKFNPIFAASKAYEDELNEINQAHRIGALSAQEQAAALETLNVRYQAAAVGSQAIEGSFGRSVQQSKQLTFQLYDIAQGLPLAFQSPVFGLQNLAVQLGQVNQLYMGQGGLRQAFSDTAAMAAGFGDRLKALGPSLLTFFTSPMGLAALAATAAGFAVATTVGIIVSRLPSAERAMKTHEEAISLIRDKWKEAASGPEEYRDRVLQAIQFAANQDVNAQQGLLTQQLEGALGMGQFTGGGVAAQLQEQLLRNQASIAWTDQQRAMREFTPAIQQFLNVVDSGGRGLEELNAEIERIANSRPAETALQNAASALRKITEEATGTIERMRELQTVMAGLRISSAFDVAEQGQTPAQRAADDLRAVMRQHDAVMAAMGARSPDELSAAARAREAASPISTDESPQGRQFRIDAAGAEAYANAVNAITEATRQRTQAMQDSVASARMDLDLTGASVGETARLRAEFQLWQDAKAAARESGGFVTPQEIADIKAASVALGDLAQSAAQATLQNDLLFQRAQMLRGEIEQTVAESMRGLYGEGYAEQMDSALAANVRYNAELERTVSIMDEVRGTTKSFFSELLRGGDVVQLLSDKLMDKGTNLLTDVLLGPQGAVGSGPIGGLLQGIIGPAAPPTMPGLSSVSTMAVTAGVVTISGAGVSALSNYAPGAITETNLPLLPGSDLEAAARAIRTMESGSAAGNYGALGPVTSSGDRAYGAYQIMGSNVGPWTAQHFGQALTPEQLLANQAAQDAVFQGQFGGYMNKYGPQGAAQAWFGGPGSVGNSGATDMLGTSVGGYGSQFASLFAQNQQQMATAGKQLTDSLAQVGSEVASTSQTFIGQWGPSLNSLLSSLPAIGQSGSAAMAAASGLAGLFANGGIMTSRGPLELTRYAMGGIANRPQLAMFGEGRRPEAYVPLPDGRSIPVTVREESRPSGSATVVNVNPTVVSEIPGTKADVRTTRRTNGDIDIEVILRQHEEAMAARYGLSEPTERY